jgi:hypothetical protein
MSVTRALALLIAFATMSATASMQDRAGGPPGVLVSRQLAESEHLAVGDVIRVAPHADGSGGREFRVAGIYEPTPDPARLGSVPREIRLHLPDLLDLTRGAATAAGTESIDGINIALATASDADAFVADVNARMPGVRAIRADRAADSAGTFGVLERFHYAIAAVTIAAATVFLLALVSEGLLNRFFQWRYDTALVFVRVTKDVAIRCVSIAVPLGAAATVVASWALLRRGGLRLVRR